MFDLTFFARKIKIKSGEEVFSDIYENIKSVKMHGPSPYYKIMLKEVDKDDSPKFFGWKDYQAGKYLFISPYRQAVEICFPYGIKIEEQSNSGKLVGFTLEDYVEVNP